ncbi:MAG: TetR/AcrR family transcriptional regulator [Ignavibacteria bacterium]|nr:TetR/AcrR family transcriptional regulator [Ignavibacteria bacterium]
MSIEKPTNRQIQAQHTKDKVYSVAIQLFETKGFENITVDEICSVANVSTGTFYNVFKSKYEILDHIFELADTYFLNTVKANVQEGLYKDRILIYFDYYADYNLKCGIEFLKQLYNVKNNLFAKKNRSMQNILKEIVEEGQQKKELSQDIDSNEMVQFLFVCVRGLVYDWCLKDGHFDLKVAMHKHVERLLKIV